MQHLLRSKIIVLSLLIFSGSASAQLRDAINMEEHDYKKFHFGINFGVNRSHYNIEHSPRFLQFDSINVIESVNSTGINLAWLVDMRLNDHFNLRTNPVNIVFTEKAFNYTLRTPNKVEGEDTLEIRKVQGITLAFPIQMKFSSDRIYNFRAYMLGGIRAEYDLAANAGKKKNDEALTLKKFSYGLEGGIGFHIYFPVFVLTPELKFTYGLNNVLDNSRNTKYSNTMTSIHARSLTLSLTVE